MSFSVAIFMRLGAQRLDFLRVAAFFSRIAALVRRFGKFDCIPIEWSAHARPWSSL